MNVSRLSRIQGSLIGGAAGDALGYAVEFMGERSIRNCFGEQGITAYKLDPRTGLAVISDDTQMTIFTAEGLLTGDTLYTIQGSGDAPHDYVYRAYQCWYDTQVRRSYAASRDRERLWLNDVPELNAGRAPGNTCLSALAGGRPGAVGKPINSSCGCGGVMRVAPLGLYIPMTPSVRGWLIREGAELAALTHSDPQGYLPAALLTAILGRILSSTRNDVTLRQIVEQAIEDTAHEFGHDAGWPLFRQLMERAVVYSGGCTPDLDCIHRLGEGWTGHEALAIAVFCALRHPDDFSACIIAAVNHKGDSDSTGAIAGNIIGAWLGLKAIGPQWTDKLELRDLMMELGQDLCDGVPKDIASKDPEALRRNSAWLNKHRFISA